MATNLRLDPEAEAALRAMAADSLRSQQELIREAVDRFLGLTAAVTPTSDADNLLSRYGVVPPRTQYRELQERVVLPPGVTTLDLLDRGDRL